MTKIIPLGLDGAFEIIPKQFADRRGFFSETYNARLLSEFGINLNFVQDNHSFSSEKGTLRGLHFQTAPFAQDKLVRVTRGSVYDVLVDIRIGSPTFNKWIGIEISAKKWNQVLVPKGFLHGFLTLEENTELIYKVSNYYDTDSDRSVRFDDPLIDIHWPMKPSEIRLSDKDANAPFLSDINSSFTYGET